MSLFINLKSEYSFCPYGCKLFNDKNDYSYWEDRAETDEEREIHNFLEKKKITNQKILHIGIGNSYIAKKLSQKNIIDGLTISSREIIYAKKLNLSNYNLFFQNKFSENNILDDKTSYYNIVIDNNLKSYSCCEKSFQKLISRYKNILNKNGQIITSIKSMYWSRYIKPVLSFSLKKFFYKRLKEFDGPPDNILSIEQCKELANKNNFELEIIENKILIFNKK